MALGGGGPFAKTRYEYRYSPELEHQPDASGAAEQALLLEPEKGTTWRLGVRRMRSSRFGIQALYGSVGFPLSGASGPLQVGLEYTSTQPPDYIPIPVVFTTSTPRPDPEGDLELDFLCFNLLGRARTEKRIQLGFSGGLSLFRVEADFASLGYQTFWLGGHGVLFSEIHEFGVESEGGHSVGGNLGIEIDASVNERWRVFGEVRAFFSPAVDLKLEVSRGTEGEQEIWDLRPGDIGPLPPLAIDPSFVSLTAGVRIGL